MSVSNCTERKDYHATFLLHTAQAYPKSIPVKLSSTSHFPVDARSSPAPLLGSQCSEQSSPVTFSKQSRPLLADRRNSKIYTSFAEVSVPAPATPVSEPSKNDKLLRNSTEKKRWFKFVPFYRVSVVNDEEACIPAESSSLPHSSTSTGAFVTETSADEQTQSSPAKSPQLPLIHPCYSSSSKVPKQLPFYFQNPWSFYSSLYTQISDNIPFPRFFGIVFAALTLLISLLLLTVIVDEFF